MACRAQTGRYGQVNREPCGDSIVPAVKFRPLPLILSDNDRSGQLSAVPKNTAAYKKAATHRLRPSKLTTAKPSLRVDPDELWPLTTTDFTDWHAWQAFQFIIRAIDVI